jgi:hypothetical protein
MSNIEVEVVPERQESLSITGRRSRIIRYRLSVTLVVISSIIIAGVTAKVWPIRGPQIQASFFLSMASSCLTLFGLVFTLCLIGTQFMTARTNVVIRRVFGPGTWLYLGFFIITVLGTLAISYSAGDSHPPEKYCPRVFSIRHCISEAQAGRASIFGVTWSLLLLLPFILYIYRRLTVDYALSSIVTSALRARRIRAFQHRCERLTSEILAVSTDAKSIEQSLAYLLELGTQAVQRSRILRKCSAYSDAHEVTRQFGTLNQMLLSNTELSAQVISSLQAWSIWLIFRSEQLNERSIAPQKITRGQARAIAGIALDSATLVLRKWQSTPDISISARASVHLLQELVAACRTHQVRASFSVPARELAKCASRKAVEGPEAEFNLAIRGLISIADRTVSAQINIGGKTVLNALADLIDDLGAMSDSRLPIPSWVLAELHELADTVTRLYDTGISARARYINSLSLLRPSETITILKGPLANKQHQKMVHIHSSWQPGLLEQIRSRAPLDLVLDAQSAAISQWAKGGDLNSVIDLFEKLASEYLNDAGEYTPVLLLSMVDNFRLAFQSHPVIQADLRSRRLEAHRRWAKRRRKAKLRAGKLRIKAHG